MQVLPPPPASRGPDILTNPVILESILPELPHLSDILALQLVSRQLYLLVQPLHPLYAREISFAYLPEVKNKDIITVLHRSLRPGPSTQRRLLADGRTVTVGEGMGKAYVGPWRFLRAITLTGTNITGRSVKLLIAASSGGKIPGLPELLRERQMIVDANGDPDPDIDTHGVTSGFFAKEFGVVSPGAYRLLADQSLRLDTLCITDCPQVDITDINNFLKKILIAVTAPKRRELRLRASQQAAAAQQQQQQQNGPANAPLGVLLAQQAAQQQQAQPLQEDLTSIPYPLPATVEELAEFGLPCLSLRRLEVANVNGLYVDPPERFRGKREWGYSKDCPFGRNIGSLNSIAGCLGLDIDVLFCQGAGCATSSDNGRWRQSNPYGFDVDDFDSFDGIIPDLANSREHNPQAPSQIGEIPASINNDRTNTRRSYHYPLPRLPGERILIAEDGRVFRIPRHALPNTINQPQHIQQMNQLNQQMNQQINQQINQQTPQQYALNILNAMHPGANHNLLLNMPGPAAGAGAATGAGVVAGAGVATGLGTGAGANVGTANAFNAMNLPAWVAGNGGNGGNGGGGGGMNGWASNLFLQDPAQYGLGVWHQPQHDNQTQMDVGDQTLMQMGIQTYPGTGADPSLPNTTVAPLNATTPAVTVTPHQQGQTTPIHPQTALAGPATIGAATPPTMNTFITIPSEGDNVGNLDNSGQVETPTVIDDDDLTTSTFMSPANGGESSTESNNAIWQGLLAASAADANGVQTPPYGQISWDNDLNQSSPIPGPSTVAGPAAPPLSAPALVADTTAGISQTLPASSNVNLIVAPPQPTTLPVADPLLAGLQWPPGPAPVPAQTQNQGQTPDIGQIPAAGVGAGIGNHPPPTLPHQNQFAQMIQPYLPATAGTGIGNPHPHHVGGFAPINLPRRRGYNSNAESRGTVSQTGTRPGRRIAMLDGPRGLCERCEREVWLCDSCNRYWVITCGGCAAKH